MTDPGDLSRRLYRSHANHVPHLPQAALAPSHPVMPAKRHKPLMANNGAGKRPKSPIMLTPLPSAPTGRGSHARKPTEESKVQVIEDSAVPYHESPFAFIDRAIASPYTEDFVYLTAVSPYDLRIVPHSSINPRNYFTMSRSGVTHFYDSENSFTPLSQWEREYFLFAKIRQIRFFKLYSTWKTFVQWRANIRRKKFESHRRELAQSLDCLNPNLRPALLAVKSLCYNTSQWKLFPIERHCGSTLSLSELIEACDDRQRMIGNELAALNSSVSDIVSSACANDLKQFLVENGFRASHQSDTLAPQASDTTLVQTDFAPRKVTHAEKAANRTKCRKLSKFIRLIDYLCIDALTALAMERTKEVLEAIQRKPTAAVPGANAISNPGAKKSISHRPAARSTGTMLGNGADSASQSLFVVELELSDAGSGHQLLFHPTVRDYQSLLSSMLETGIAALLNCYDRLLTNQSFHHYTKASSDDRTGAANGNDSDDGSNRSMMDTALLNDRPFVDLKTTIATGLDTAFTEAAKYASSFETHRDLFVKNENTDISAYSSAPVSVFESLIADYTQQMASLASMATAASIGIILVDSSRLKALFAPSPKLRLSELERLMPQVARDCCKAQLATVKDWNTRLAIIPSSVEEFVSLMEFLAQLESSIDQSDSDYDFVQSLYTLMADSSIRVPESDKLTFEKLTQMRSQFRASLMLSEAAIYSNTERFAKELEGQAPALQTQVKHSLDKLADPLLMSLESLSDPSLCIEQLKAEDARVFELEAKIARFSAFERVLAIESGAELREEAAKLRAEVDVKLSLWGAIESWTELTQQWIDTPLDAIDAPGIEAAVQHYQKVVQQSRRALGDEQPIVKELKSRIGEFSETIPVVTDLRSNNLQARHWDAIESLLGHTIRSDPGFSLGTLVKLDAMKYKNEINSIAYQAQQEAALTQQLNGITSTWSTLSFLILPYKDAKDVYILGSCEEILVELDASFVSINGILSSRFVQAIKDTVDDVQRRLLTLSEVIEEWATVQRSWMYLEVIFASGDIVRQLPEEFAAFSKVDKQWKELMRRTNDNPNCLISANTPGLKELLVAANQTLDRIQKALESYLETRRQAFPRFYFLSNDELLLILSQSKNLEAVQPHLAKCFDAIASLEFSDNRDIKSMISGEGERVMLGANLKARGPAESWLPALEIDMIKSLRKYIKKGVVDYERQSRIDWILQHHAQIVAVASLIQWAREAEQAIVSDTPAQSLKQFHASQIAQLTDLTALVRSDLSSIDRKKIIALIVTDVHNRDITEQLGQAGVASTSAFLWQQQLRFEWNVDRDDCIVRQAAAEFVYGYEYQGVTSRLVITPLTDRCWMTITGALQLCYGASPQGPAGTGKTESTKDLAKALGQMCIVVNCGEGMNYKTMAKLFSGLAQTGGWTCLDEFNRIDIEVLSVVAQQLLSVRQALMARVTEFLFDGAMIPLRPTFGVMITMNPGYAGRTELPENLKVLFRPVSMMIPDYALIAEMMLFAEGFSQASALSKKMVKLYKLCSEQLSQQDHYDFGMRAVKSVLVMAGALKRAQPDVSEDMVLIRAMKNANEAKFIAADLPLFHALIEDLFPSVLVPLSPNEALNTAITDAATKLGLQSPPVFVDKVVQLYETLCVRFGVMLVGNTGGGKSSAMKSLAAARNALSDSGHPNMAPVTFRSLNPKSISMDELYGSVSAMTQEWSDGLASTIMREAMMDRSSMHHWVHFDGPVDALWIESMNTVLDDNQTLCLVNGERMKLKNEMRMIFEVADLAVASPATVSRCGMVYITHEDLGPMPAVTSFIHAKFGALSESLRQSLLALFARHLPASIEYLRKQCKETLVSSNAQITASTCAIVEAILIGDENAAVIIHSGNDADIQKLIDFVFAFALTWGVGGALEGDEAMKFNAHLLSILPPSVHPPQSAPSFFDHRVNVNKQCWSRWSAAVPSFQYSASVPYSSLMVPTVATVKYQWLLESLITIDRPVYLTGGSGVGKSLIVSDFFSRPSSESRFVLQSLAFSAQSSARATQESIEAKLVKYRKNLLGAPTNQRHIVFIDDVNLCGVEQFGAQPPIELLRQMIEYKGVYDRTKLFWKSLQGVTAVCAAAPAMGGGRHEMSPRCLRHFTAFAMPQPGKEILQSIFSAILKGFLEPFPTSVAALESSLVESTVTLYLDVCQSLLPTPSKSHYTFNLRDVSAVIGGMLQIKPEHCKNPDTMVRLWLHESERCFADRLVDDHDHHWFRTRCCQLLQSSFQVQWSENEVFNPNRPILFADWLRPGLEKDYMEFQQQQSTETTGNTDTERSNESASRPSVLASLLGSYLDDYNTATNSHWSVVFFGSAIAHIARLTRILRQPRGHALLIGVGGSGKQTYTKLAAFICGMNTVTLSMSKGYGYTEFQADLRKVLFEAGVRGVDTALIIADHQIVDERFLEDVNALLNSGEVGNLFTGDDLTRLVEELSPVCRELGLAQNKDSVYGEFVRRVRRRLHIVLCMSPVGDSFRVRCRQFPSLINCTTIDWFTPWSAEALRAVAERFLGHAQFSQPELKSSLISACVTIHQSVEVACKDYASALNRRVYTTPKSYLDWIALYLRFLHERSGALSANRAHFVTGLTKLKETQAVVTELQETLTQLQPVLAVKAKETETLMAQVAVDSEKADAVRVVVEAEEKTVNAAATEVREIAASAQADLDAAMPPLRAALKALEKLKKAEISEVKSMASPPVGVVKTMEMVCILLNVPPDWDSAKKLLANVNFLKDLQSFDKENIDPKAIKKLAKYTADPDLTEERMNQISRAGAALLTWVLAMIDFSKVSKIIGPKKEKLAELNGALAEKEKQLAEKQAQLATVVESVESLQAKYSAAIEEKRVLDEKSVLTAARLERAEKLIGGLGGEEARWTAEAATLDAQLVAVTGNVFIATAAIAYYGPFTGEYRQRLIQQWKAHCQSLGIPMSADFSLQTTLGSPYEIKHWLSNGLPTDDTSIDSGILVKRSYRWPLCIDPQEQAKKWLKNEHRSKLMTARMTQRDLLKVVEIAIKHGAPLLIEDIGETLDGALEPVLSKSVYQRGAQSFLRLGEQEIEYNDRFCLYLTTKLANPHYLPETQIQVTLLNFTVTQSGLEDQLLGEVVRKERPDVEEKRNKLIAAMAKDKKLLSELEEKILHLLATTEGNLLDSVSLISTLEESKFTSQVIEERVKDNLVTQADIATIRESYRPVARRGALMYFIIAELPRLDPMYEYSLAYFLRLFHHSLAGALPSPVLEERIQSVLDALTTLVFTTVNRGLFERHKLMFAFQLATAIEMEAGRLTEREWQSLIKEAVITQSQESFGAAVNPFQSSGELSDKQWATVRGLEARIPSLAGLTADITTHAEAWSQWLTQPGSKLDAPLPTPAASSASAFARLLVFRCVEPESLTRAASDFVRAHLGASFVSQSNASLDEVFASSDPRTPIMFVLSAGADPTAMIMKIAKEKGAELSFLSLGQGQGDRAAKMIQHASQRGEWLCLANLHLGKSWLSTLEEIVETLSHEESPCHAQFRLFFTSMPCDYFPVSILQKSVKITNEPPTGLRANLTRSFASVIDQAIVQWADGSDSAALRPYKPLLFALVFFHALVQERRWFGPIGFVNHGSSEWNDSDLETSIATLKLMLEQNESDEPPLEALRYVIGEIHYGGRVTDEADRKLLNVILARLFNERIQAPEFTFSESGLYRPLGTEASHSEYCDYLAQLPEQAEPEVFGMHANATLTLKQQLAERILSDLNTANANATVSSISAADTSSAAVDTGSEGEDFVRRRAREIAATLPAKLDKSTGLPSLFALNDRGVMASLSVVLVQELDRFNRLLTVMARTLRELERAFKGEIALSAELDDVQASIALDRVPKAWTKCSYLSLKTLTPWMKDLRERVTFFRDWLVHGEPKVFWLSAFFFPQGFLTGVLQRHARSHALPIDTLTWDFEARADAENEDELTVPDDGVIVRGLFVEGARWDRDAARLADSRQGELFALLPPVHFRPVALDARRRITASMPELPVYKTSDRRGVLSTTGQSTNFILPITLPADREATQWTLRGAACVTQLNE